MAASISKVSSILTANSDGFVSAYKKAESQVQGFASSVASVAAGLAVYDVAKTAVSGVANATVDLVKESLASIDVVSKQARALGVSTEALTRLQYAASFSGLSTETLSAGLKKMLVTLGGVTEEGEPSAEVFAKLGLNLADLKALSPERQFAVLGDKLAGIQDPATRAALATKIFGKAAGTELLPLLLTGSDAIRQMGEEADRTGNTVSTLGGLKVEAANDAIDRLSKLITGAGRALAVELSPYITAAADEMTRFATSGGGVGVIVTGALESVATSIAYVSDYVAALRGVWNVAQVAMAAAVYLPLKAVDLLGQGLVDLTNLLPGVNATWKNGFAELTDSIGQQIGVSLSDAGDAFVQFGTSSASDAVKKTFASIKQQADAAAIAAQQSAVAVTEIQPALEKGNDKIDDGLKEQQKAYEEAERLAKRYYEATRTPQEKYQEELEQINRLVEMGTLDEDTAARARAKAADDLAKALPKDQFAGDISGPKAPDAPKLLQAGSQAALQFVAELQRQQRADDPAKQALKKQDVANGHLATLVDLIRSNGSSANLKVV